MILATVMQMNLVQLRYIPLCLGEEITPNIMIYYPVGYSYYAISAFLDCLYIQILL